MVLRKLNISSVADKTTAAKALLIRSLSKSGSKISTKVQTKSIKSQEMSTATSVRDQVPRAVSKRHVPTVKARGKSSRR